jgi:hypothetical protein
MAKGRCADGCDGAAGDGALMDRRTEGATMRTKVQQVETMLKAFGNKVCGSFKGFRLYKLAKGFR